MNAPMRPYWIFFGTLFLIAMIASVAFIANAQRSDDAEKARVQDAPRPENRDRPLNLKEEEIQEVVQIAQLYALEKDLGLSEEQLTRVLPKWRRLNEMRRSFWDSRRERLDRVSDALKRSESSGGGSAGLDQALQRFRSEDDSFWSDYRKLEDEILADLTPAQRLKYIVLDSEQPRQTGRLIRTLRRLSENSNERRPDAAPEPPPRQD